MKYLDKDAVIAEIERRLHFDRSWIEGDERRQKRTTSVSTAYYKRVGSKQAGEAFLDYVNSLDTKEVDVEKKFNHFLDNVDGVPRIWHSEEQLEWGKEIAKYFFTLGLNEQKEEPTSKDLEEAAIEYCSGNKGSDARVRAGFIMGAKWQKKQMMSKAIDGEVGYWNLHGLSVNVELPGSVEEGDKVKVLLVKEE